MLRYCDQSDLHRFNRDLNHVLRRFERADASDHLLINVWANEEGATLTTELPGIAAKDIDISVSGDTIVIAGERKQEKVAEGQVLHRQERRFGAFKRSIKLPFRVDADKVQAKYELGVLAITVSKSAEDQPRSIPVN